MGNARIGVRIHSFIHSWQEVVVASIGVAMASLRLSTIYSPPLCFLYVLLYYLFILVFFLLLDPPQLRPLAPFRWVLSHT